MMNTNIYPIKRLTRREFASALQKGLGRAYLHVSHYGLDDVSDLVLKACLQDQSYDPQTESSKAKWLFTMFKDSPQRDELANAIISSLKTKRDTWDLQQLFELSLILAQNGDEQAREALQKRVFEKASKPSSDDWLGSDEWIALTGLDGALDLARIYGTRLLNNSNDIVPDHFGLFPINKIEEALNRALKTFAGQDKALQTYREYLAKSNPVFTGEHPDKETRLKRRHEEMRRQYNLISILNDAKNKKGDYPGFYTTFGQHATTGELETIFNAFLKEKDDEIRLRLLWVFRRSQIPTFDESLLKWAKETDGQYQDAAINALAQFSDVRIHEWAKQKVSANELSDSNSNGLRLFILNYEKEDALLITKTLISNRYNKEDLHTLVWDIIDISKQNHDPSLAEVLRWGYEKTPCSNCRHSVIVQLNEINQFNGEMLQEGQFDSKENIAALAKAKTDLKYPEIEN